MREESHFVQNFIFIFSITAAKIFNSTVKDFRIRQLISFYLLTAGNHWRSSKVMIFINRKRDEKMGIF